MMNALFGKSPKKKMKLVEPTKITVRPMTPRSGPTAIVKKSNKRKNASI